MTTLNGWLQITAFCALLALLAWPLSAYLHRVLNPALASSPARFASQSWQHYLQAVLVFNGLGLLWLFLLLRFQGSLPLNPQGFPSLSADLAFNVATSFVTNTNWQSYGGESTLSHFSQMIGLGVQNFASAATGIAVCMALLRGLTGDQLGNFWQDLYRSTAYVLLPAALLTALVLVWQGVPQNFSPDVLAQTLEGGQQVLAQGPVASQEAIKQIGSNGGGFFNANSAHPYENPTAFSNLVECLWILLLAAAFPHVLGRMSGNAKQGWMIFGAMMIVFVASVSLIYVAESQAHPLLGVPSMEGKETRFGVAGSSLWAAATTAASNGSVNAMHDSFSPLGGGLALFNILLGEVVFGGVGAGLYGMLLFVLLTVFIAGLMVGRSPEYLGKKIESHEMRWVVIGLIAPSTSILLGSALALCWPNALSALANDGAHGFTELLYAFASAGGNNGSAFAGLSANAPFYNTVLGVLMLIGRFAVIVPVLVIAGALAAKKAAPPSAGTLPTDNGLFVGLLIAVVVVLGGLTFLPALVLGPVTEHLLLFR